MSEPFPMPFEGPRASLAGSPDERTLDELRALLGAEERARLDALEEAELDPDRVADVLPEAILRRETRDDRVARALGSTIEAGLFRSARKDPKALADAIHPALGPAIRGMIQATLRDSLEKLNVALENSLSPQGIRWRLEAARSGKPFSEVVLLKTLLFRVEQAMLVHNATGLVIREVHAPMAAQRDADLVAGMLSAIRDFAADSFGQERDQHLQEIEFAGRTLILAQGPTATLSLVVGGNPPRELHARAQETVDALHVEYGAELEGFDGDGELLVGADATLEDLLESEERPRRENKWIRAIPVGIAALLLAWLTVNSVTAFRNQRQLAEIRAALAAAPGIRPLEVERSGGRLLVTGLADPVAPRAPETIVRALLGGEALELVLDFEPIASLDDACVLERARRTLGLESGLRLSFHRGELIVYDVPGSSTLGQRLLDRATLVQGVERVVLRP